MQLATTSTAATPPARDAVRANLGGGIGGQIPDRFLDARVGKGTVASEYNRTLSFRVEGDGPPSQRRLVAQTPSAQAALASKAGPAIEQLVRRTMSVGDAHAGKENLRSITLVPDEHAMKAVEALGRVVAYARDNPGPVQFSAEGTPEAERAAIKEFVGGIASTSPQENANTLAWNLEGDITVMPDVSRRLLATIDAYRLQDGDAVTGKPAAVRSEVLRDDWDTLIHEANHSVTPEHFPSSEAADAWEEAIPTVIARRDRTQASRDAGADIPRIAKDPGAGRDDAQLGWAAWNRSHLPKPTKQQSEHAATTYGDGPQTLRHLLNLAGIDRRTTAGRQATIDLLQGRAAEHVPRDVADRLIAHLGIDPSLREGLVRRVRESVLRPEGVRYVTDWLAAKGAPAG
jgi:hypothetical protein